MFAATTRWYFANDLQYKYSPFVLDFFVLGDINESLFLWPWQWIENRSGCMMIFFSHYLFVEHFSKHLCKHKVSFALKTRLVPSNLCYYNSFRTHARSQKIQRYWKFSEGTWLWAKDKPFLRRLLSSLNMEKTVQLYFIIKIYKFYKSRFNSLSNSKLFS